MKTQPIEPAVPERIWIDWANTDSRIFYYVRPCGLEIEAVEYVPRSNLDIATAELSKADNEIVGCQEKLREQQKLLERYELDFNDLIETGAAEVKSLQEQVKAEQALKWIHFENAAKFDEEVRNLKKLVESRFAEAIDQASRVFQLALRNGESWEGVEQSLRYLLDQSRKTPEEVAHEDSYWDDPLRGTNKC